MNAEVRMKNEETGGEQPAPLQFLILDFRRCQCLCVSTSLWQNQVIDKKFVTASHGKSRRLNPRGRECQRCEPHLPTMAYVKPQSV